MKDVRALVRYTMEREVVVLVNVEDDDFGPREVEDAVYSSGEFLDAIDLDVQDYEVIG